MSAEHVETRSGAYADSVTLMQVSADARRADGVEAALIAMATELNLGLLPALGFRPPAQASADDLLIAIRASGQSALAAALTIVEARLTARPAVPDGGLEIAPPRTTASAVRTGGRGLALISVPGRFAFAEAMDALTGGCDVMIFSDNVPVAEEILLKDLAAERGLIVMGPDCGTAIIGGVGLGFSHTLASGPIGLVAASGTGAQQVLCLLDHAGAGVSAAIGVGGRDLTSAVAGRSTRAALAALDDDPATELILLVSKPPALEVADALRAHVAALATPVRFAFVAPGEPDLTAAAEGVLSALGMAVPVWPHWRGAETGSHIGSLCGLFAGGTLCDEAMIIASERLGPVMSNIPLREKWRLRPGSARGHTMIDFGADELTVGRAHPMIDQSLRLDRLAAAAADPAVACIMLDVVLGHSAHPDPAGELGPALAAARSRRDVAVVVSLIGAASDPQDLTSQARQLQAAGAHVFASNAQAARFACDAVAGMP